MEIQGSAFELTGLFIQLGINFPLYLALGFGMMKALEFRGRYPSSATKALWGFATTLVTSIISTIFSHLLPQLLSTSDGGVATLGAAFAVVGIASMLLHTLAWGLIISALLDVWRQPTAPLYGEQGRYDQR